MDDCLILGAGVIGLSLGYELAGRGARVQIVDRAQPGRAASWAGAGILPPMTAHTSNTPLERLAAISHELHARWATELREMTGIDTGYRVCGGIYLPTDRSSPLTSEMDSLTEMGVAVERMTASGLAVAEPRLAVPPAKGPDDILAYRLPHEAQLRNPRHLRALAEGCRKRGATILAESEVTELRWEKSSVRAARVGTRWIEAGQFCIATGAWSSTLATQTDLPIDVHPIRGQIALLRHQPSLIQHIINYGRQYVVPRDDGRVLVGATQEDVGFDCRTTVRGIGDLLALAYRLVPELETATVETTWAGLRPGTRDGLPYIGPHPRFDNLFVATGHFRHGLHLSPGTAVLLADCILKGRLPGELVPFALDRHPR